MPYFSFLLLYTTLVSNIHQVHWICRAHVRSIDGTMLFGKPERLSADQGLPYLQDSYLRSLSAAGPELSCRVLVFMGLLTDAPALPQVGSVAWKFCSLSKSGELASSRHLSAFHGWILGVELGMARKLQGRAGYNPGKDAIMC